MYFMLQVWSETSKEHCTNVHTKKTEHAVETDEEEELDEPLAEEESEDEGKWRQDNSKT